jgi:8-oxo-dGTP pyrophosphatase MutT (NUDIX family)
VAALPGRVQAGELFGPLPVPDGGGRASAVLMLFGESEHGPDVLLTQRAVTLRSHPGQVSFPGGAVDDGDAGPEAAALREASEETGLDPDGVQISGSLPPLHLSVSGYTVTPPPGTHKLYRLLQ